MRVSTAINCINISYAIVGAAWYCKAKWLNSIQIDRLIVVDSAIKPKKSLLK